MEHFIEECEFTKDWFIGKDTKEIMEKLWGEKLDGSKGRMLRKLWKEKEKVTSKNRKETRKMRKIGREKVYSIKVWKNEWDKENDL